MSILSRLREWIGGNRFLKQKLRWVLPETAPVRVTDRLGVYVDYRDLTGPSYYLLHGGAAAFYHYEEIEKGEMIRGMSVEGVFVDIGANIGLFSLFVANFLPHSTVFSFEPHPRLHECLSKTA
jgi:hypothetical protein